LKAGGSPAGFLFPEDFSCFPEDLQHAAFIAHSRNKSGRNHHRSEHRAKPAVVGVGNAFL
jgi:hypothetical protein